MTEMLLASTKLVKKFGRQRNFCHSRFSDNCLHYYAYIHNVSADMSSDLLQMLIVELESLHGNSNHLFYSIHEGSLF